MPLYYERPNKRPRRPQTPEETPARPRGGIPGYFDARRDAREAQEQERLAREEAEKKRAAAKRRRRAVWDFFFATPNHRRNDAYPVDDGYVDEVSAPAPRRKSRHLFIKFVCLLLALTVAFAGLLYIVPISLLGSHDGASLMALNQLPSGCTHVLLMGVDRDTNGTSRSDTMIVMSIGNGAIHLTSLLRDTGVSIPGKSGSHRLNAAYAYGGAELTLQTINQNFGLNITRYALVDYESFPQLIDLIGGIDLSVTDAEAQQINNNVGEVLYRSYKTGQSPYDVAYSRYQQECLAKGGENLRLTGMQALGYARIRNLDSDYGRTNRQRKVLTAAAKRLKSFIYRPVELVHFALSAIAMVETNMSTLEILSLGEKAILSGSIEQTRLPAPGTYRDDGGMFYNIDFAANREKFIEFVYGENAK